jgi:hypothetical protein
MLTLMQSLWIGCWNGCCRCQASTELFNEDLSHTKTFARESHQCTQPASIITDFGERQVRPGDWIIEGENREHLTVASKR